MNCACDKRKGLVCHFHFDLDAFILAGGVTLLSADESKPERYPDDESEDGDCD